MTETHIAPCLAIIAAMDRNYLIGSMGMMPWHIPEDLAYFKDTTMGSIVVMGRRTWRSLRSPLPGRENVVLSRDPGFTAEGAVVLSGITDVMRHCEGKRAFVIGGADVFRQFLPLVDQIYQTLIDAEFEGDTWFPALDPSGWRIVSSQPQKTAQGLDICFNVLSRNA